jgi:hypothetical protein
LGAGGWVYTGLKPDGGRLIVFCTEDTVPSSLARRLPNLTFPTYSQQIGPKAPGQKANPGS